MKRYQWASLGDVHALFGLMLDNVAVMSIRFGTITVPRAGLLGSLAAIALTLIAFLPMLLHGIATVPLVGLISLVVILLTLVAHRQLPFKFPGALAAVLIGVVIYWAGFGIDYLSSNV